MSSQRLAFIKFVPCRWIRPALRGHTIRIGDDGRRFARVVLTGKLLETRARSNRSTCPATTAVQPRADLLCRSSSAALMALLADLVFGCSHPALLARFW